MKNIGEIDKNFKAQAGISKENVRFYPVPSERMHLYGVFVENGKFRRMPETVAKTVSCGVYELHAHTAGGRVRFKTDSSYVAIYAKMPVIYKMGHFALCGSGGFDIYADNDYVKSYIPAPSISDEYQGVVDIIGERRVRDITINLPLYSEVSELFIGLEDNAVLESPNPYRIEKPICFYGSSITQGGCASRPGTAYNAIVSRYFDADIVNLGFSGNAKGEVEIGDYIKGLDMSAFVYDYDFNAPNNEHLKSTHERMFLQIREANPTLPIVIMSKPKWNRMPADLDRLDTIRKTYENAVTRGDKNVYFIDGKSLMSLCENEGTVDGTHPTDLGFFSMARELISVLEKILN